VDAPEQAAAAKARAEKLLADIRGGADFGQVATVNSADPGSARDNGYLPPAAKGAYVPEFDAAGHALAPGEVSDVVKTQFGFHILRRPTLAEAADRFTVYARQATSRVADSAYMAELTTSKKLVVAKDAPAKLLAALNDMAGSRKSKAPLATYTGGPLTVGRFLEWAATAPPQFVQQAKAADTTQLQQFVKMLATNELVVKQADSAKVQITAEEWTKLYTTYTNEIDSVSAGLGLMPGADKKATAAVITGFFEKLVVGQARLRPLPQALPSVLRDNGSAKINNAGILKAIEIAKALQAKSGGAPGAMQPAPGPAPVPGGEAPPAPAPVPAPEPGN
jgi:hypothetical protein